MSRYIYTCEFHPDIREEVIHSMKEDPPVRCPECDRRMHRVPQAFQFYMNPQDTLINQMDTEYRKIRGKNKKGK